MDMLWQTLGFAAKALVVFLTITVTFAVVFSLARRGRGRRGSGLLEVTPLNRRFEALGDGLRAAVLERKEFKRSLKRRAKERQGSASSNRPNVYVLDFEGDLFASAVTSLREEVSAVIAVAKPNDEVVVRLESPGGAVPHYGLAAAQLARLREKKVKLTVCVDRVAASGGYMMACVADHLLAAPFAIIGSIGVVAQVPNVNKLLKRFDVDYEEMTAGEFKRTVSLLGPITDAGRKKFQEQLEDTHHLFKDFVKAQRPKLDIDAIATGEYWLGRRSLEVGLVDALGTSDDYLLGRAPDANVYRVHFRPERSLRDRLGRFGAGVVEAIAVRLISRYHALQLR